MTPNSAVKWKVLPRPDFAFDPDSPSHQADQLRRDGQSQAGAAEAPRGRAVDLAERLEDALLFVGGDADAGVLDGAVQSHGPLGVALPARRWRTPRRGR